MSKTPVFATLTLALTLALALPFRVHAQEAAAAPPPPAVPWCQIDDPAAWRLERERLIAKKVKDLSKVPCPLKTGGAPLPIEMTLPMPCGRSMTFRRIDVPVEHALDHISGSFGRSVDITAETPQTVLSNGPWTAPISGTFSVDGEGGQTGSDQLGTLAAKAYYIAKYELTLIQWMIFEMGLLDMPAADTRQADAAACVPLNTFLATQDLRQIVPKGGLSWFDAVDFSRAYSTWLIARDADRLASGKSPDMPWEQGATGYVRLPTEAEWEYAARGGASFTTPQGRSQRLPMIPDPETGKPVQPDLREVCAEAPRNASRRFAGVGQTTANVFGLYDLVCNAEEITFDLFRMTRPDGLSGQVGGVITKGGNSTLLREQNTVGRRTEAQALFNVDGEGRTSTMGARLLVSAPVFAGRRDSGGAFVQGLANEPLEKALLSGRTALLDGGVGLEEGKSDDLEAEVNKLRRAISEGQLTQSELQNRAAQLQIEMERLSVRLRQSSTEEIRLSIRSAIVTGNLIDRIGRNMFAGMREVEKLRAIRPQTGETRSAIKNALLRLSVNDQRIDAAFDLYLQVHAELGSRNQGFVALQINETKRGLSGASVDVFGQYLALFEQHHKEIRTSRGQVTETIRNTWLDKLDSVRDLRRRRFPDLQTK